MTSTKLLRESIATVRAAERRLVAGEISRPQFDAVAGSNAARLAEAAERYLWLRDEAGRLELDAAIDAAMKGGD